MGYSGLRGFYAPIPTGSLTARDAAPRCLHQPAEAKQPLTSIILYVKIRGAR